MYGTEHVSEKGKGPTDASSRIDLDRQTTHRIGRRRENWAPIVTLGGYDRSSCTTTRSSARYLTYLGSLGPVRRSVEEGEIAPMREQRSLTRSNTPSSFQNPGRPPFFK